MDFVTHLSRTLRRHDDVWVIMDRLTKSAHFLAVRMTFTLEEFCRLYVYLRGCPTTWSTSVHSIEQGTQVYGAHLEEFPKGCGDTVDDVHCVSSANKWSVGDDHTGFKGHVVSMRPGS